MGRILIRHRITQSDLAAMAGVARESVSRTLREWHRQKVLEGSPRAGYVVHKIQTRGRGGGRSRETNSVGQEGAHSHSYTTNWGDGTRLKTGAEPASSILTRTDWLIAGNGSTSALGRGCVKTRYWLES